MGSFPSDRSKLRVLITNDDGIESDGLALLEKIVRQVTDDVWICAPHFEQSACSHSVTLSRAIKLIDHGGQRFSVMGTPTDAVLLAVYQAVEGRKPDLVVSGINRGRNVGNDITYSGTVAAAMEGAILGIPAIAFSQAYNSKEGLKWDVAERHLLQILEHLLGYDFPPNVVINVNFPDGAPDDVKPPQIVRQGRHHFDDPHYIRADAEDPSSFWIGSMPKTHCGNADTDISVIVDGGISITPIGLDYTAYEALDSLREVFA